jgi:hypothetical protein
MKVTKLREFSMDVRDASFLDQHSLALITPAADVWRASVLSSGEELMFSGKDILHRVAERLVLDSTKQPREIPKVAAELKPCHGGYPRLATSDRPGWVVVNTHDMVLVACRDASFLDAGPFSRRTAPEMRLLTWYWGEYYRHFDFSADGSWLALPVDGGCCMIFNMHDLTRRLVNVGDPYAWHPGHPTLFGFNRDGWLVSLDVTQPGLEPEILYNLEYDSVTGNIDGIWVHPSGESCVTISRDGWSWWQLKPFQLLSQGPIPGGQPQEFYTRPGIPRLAVDKGRSIWLGALDTRQNWSWIELPSQEVAKFSPSGRYMVTLGLLPTDNPWPMYPRSFARTATLWEIETE